MENEDPKLSVNEKRSLTIQAGLQAIPYVGGSLSTIYFGSKQEKRFKRLESFYDELAKEIEGLSDQIPPVENHDAGSLEAILEDLNEKVESEVTLEKRKFFKSYFKNTLKHPIQNNFDERKTYLKVLGELSLLECEMMSFIHAQKTPVKVGALQKPGVEQYAIVGAIGKLRSCGFLGVRNDSIQIGGGDNALNDSVVTTPYGKKFIEFCLE